MLFCMFHHLFLCVLLTAACMSVPYSPNWGQTCILLLCNPRAHNNNNSQKHSLSIYHVPNTVLLSSIFLFNLKNNPKRFSLVQSLSHVRLFATLCQVSLSITNSQSLLKLMPIQSVMPSNHLILCHPLLLPPSNFPSIRVFSNELVGKRWPKVAASGGQSIGASASASVLPMNIQDWFPFRWTGWISLPSKGLSRVFPNTTVQKHQFFGAQLSF